MPVDVTDDYIRVRVRDQGDFEEDSFRTVVLSEKDGIKSVQGHLKGETTMTIQSYLFDKDKWSKEEAVSWVEKHKQKKTARENAFAEIRVQFHDCALNEIDPGIPDDAEQPKARESMESYYEQVKLHITANGWDTLGGNGNPPYDLVIEQLYKGSAICVDLFSGEYYLIEIKVDADGAMTLGQPEPYDVAYIPSSREPIPRPAEEPKAKAAELWTCWPNDRQTFVASKARVSESNGRKLPAFDVLIMSSGWTGDGRYFPRAVVEAAVAGKLFDGIACFYQHPMTPEGKETGERPDFPCGIIKTGSIRVKENAAGEVDVIGTVVMAETDTGRNVAAIIQASQAAASRMLGNSMHWYGESIPGIIDGRNADVQTSISEVISVDFLRWPAFPRTGVMEQIAERRNQQTEELTMDEKQELAKLREERAALAAQLALKEKEAAVEAMLGKTSLPDNLKPGVKIMLMQLTTEEDRKAQLDLIVDGFWKKADAGRLDANAAKDGGSLDEVKLTKYAKEDKLMSGFDRACGLSPAFVERARAQMEGRTSLA